MISLGVEKIEIYSFGVDGGRNMNGYNVFLKDIYPIMSFDGIIIAPYEIICTVILLVMMIDNQLVLVEE